MLKQLWIDLRTRLVGLFCRRHLHLRAEEEIRTHLAMREERLVQSGLTAEEARLRVRREFGNPMSIREASVDAWPFRMFDVFRQDVQHAVRIFRRTSGFTTTAVLSLALGIGATGAVFSLVDALFFRDLPLRDPESLVTLASRFGVPNGPGEPLPFDSAVIADLESLPVFSGIAGETLLPLARISIDGATEPRRSIMRVADGYFDVLGIAPAVGTADSDVPSAILSDRYWNIRFQRSPGAIGSTLSVDGSLYTITGVAPKGFIGWRLDRAVDAWLIEPDTKPGRAFAIARLEPGVTPAQAAAAVDTVLEANPLPQLPEGLRVAAQVTPAGKGITTLRSQYGRALVALSILVGLVLAATCINIGSLLVARNASRSSELTVRAVLGARRTRLAGQLVVEGFLLALLGCGLAVPVAFAADAGITSMLPVAELPAQLAPRLDLRVLGFLTAVSVLCALVFSSAPAWQSTKIELASRLGATSSVSSPQGRRSLGQWLLAVQVLMSVVLMTGAGLFVKTLGNAAAVDPGFETQGLLHVHIGMPYAGYSDDPDDSLPLYRSLGEQLTALPGVASVSASRNPLMQPGPVFPIEIDGISGVAAGISVGSRFFETMGIPVLRGRSFTPTDEARAALSSSGGDPGPNLLIVSHSFAEQFFPDQDPIGRPVPDTPGGPGSTIVGVVGDARLSDIHDEPYPTVYTLFVRNPSVLDSFVVRADGSPDAVAGEIQLVLRRIDPRLLTSIDEMDTMIRRSMSRERLVATTSAFFGALVLGLAGIGLFGVVSFTVAKRTNELGVRIALGAGRQDIVREVLMGTGKAFAAGLAAGSLAAAALARLSGSVIEGLLFGVQPTDIANLLTIGGMITLVAVVACLIPVTQALSIDPLRAIRYE